MYEWSTSDDGDFIICGSYSEDMAESWGSVKELKGNRCIELIERVRDHWVVDTWLECSEGETSKLTKLRTHKYLKQLLRGAELHV